MHTTRATASTAALICIALGTTTACRVGTTWNVDTVYEVRDVSEDGKSTLERSLSDPRVRDKYGYELVTRGRDGQPFVFKLTAVRDMKTLRQVQETIQAVSRYSRYPIELMEAHMTFASVYGQAASTITINGTATPGATVTLDVGEHTVEAPVNPAGKWEAAISRNGKLSDRGGWVYGSIRKGSAMHFIKMNILDTMGSVRVLPEDLPRDSLLLR